MKKYLLALCLILFLGASFAQKGKKDIVFLKSGSVVKGQLMTHDAEIVKINSAGNEWVFNVAEVDSIFRKATPGRADWLNPDYFLDTSLGVLVGNSSNAHNAPFTFMASFNYRVIDKLYLGAGLGAEFLEESYMPAFGQLTYQFRNAPFSPFMSFQMGYLVALEDGNHQGYTNYYPAYYDYYPGPQTNQKLNAEGGLFFNPSFGFRHFTSENFGWFFAFGYRHHQLNFSGSNDYRLESNYSRLSLKVGFIFN